MQVQIQQLRDELRAHFPERQDVIDGTLVAILSGEHVLLLGPPGTAKSALVRAIAHAFGAVLFERVLTRHTMPEELLGPVSLQSLEEGRFVHVTSGMLPQAHLALVGDVFTASSVLNVLLPLMDERVFIDDGAPVPVPLISLFGTTTEMPESNAMDPLLERFLLRFEMDYMARPTSIRTILTSPEPTASTVLGLAALRTMQTDVAKVKLTGDTLDALLVVRDTLKSEGLMVSDRRWKKSLRLVQAAAYIAGESQTSPEDLVLLVDMIWSHPRERPKAARHVRRLASPLAFQAGELLEAARETAARTQALRTRHWRAYLAQAALALVELRTLVEMLVELSKSASRRAGDVIENALTEVNGMHAELARDVHASKGLKVLK